MTVAVLFARKDSIYKKMDGCDVWDIERDARKWPGGCPIVGHPPCRAWAGLRGLAKPRPDEKALATWCVDQIRRWGGVLEHPAASTLWEVYGLPEPGSYDQFGGFTITAPQWWWGHLANKATRFYICGTTMKEVPTIPFKLGEAEFVVATNSKSRYKPTSRKEIKKSERERTPQALAEWLVELAGRCKKPEVGNGKNNR